MRSYVDPARGVGESPTRQGEDVADAQGQRAGHWPADGGPASSVNHLSEGKGVQRAGNVVVRPAAPWAPAIHALLRHLETSGFTGAPRLAGTGRDGAGREAIAYLPGDVAALRIWSDEAMHELGRLMRRLHDATATFKPPPDAVWQDSFLRTTANDPDAVFSHGDAAPWNVVARNNLPFALIDWELAGPVDRLNELAHTAWLNAQLYDDAIAAQQGQPPPAERISQLRHFADGYSLAAGDRHALVTRLVDVAVLSSAQDAVEAGITPGTTGHPLMWGVVWRARAAAWLVRNRASIERALR